MRFSAVVMGLVLLAGGALGQLEDETMPLNAEEFLDRCEAGGKVFAAEVSEALCATINSKCTAAGNGTVPEWKPKFEVPRDALKEFTQVLQDSCYVVFTTSCEKQAVELSYVRLSSCHEILLEGPDEGKEECPDEEAIFNIVEAELKKCSAEELLKG